MLVLPSLGPDGWMTEPIAQINLLFAWSLASDDLQVSGENSFSFSALFTRYEEDISELCNKLESKYLDYFTKYATNGEYFEVEVSYLELQDSKYALLVYIAYHNDSNDLITLNYAINVKKGKSGIIGYKQIDNPNSDLLGSNAIIAEINGDNYE